MTHDWISVLLRNRSTKKTARKPRRRHTGKICLERLEDRLAPATFTENGTLLYLNFNVANKSVAIVSAGTSYSLTLTGDTWSGTNVPGRVTGQGGSTLTVTAAAFGSVNIVDNATGCSINFNDSQSFTYSSSFSIDFTGNQSGAITFNGSSTFTGTASLYAETSKNIVVNGTVTTANNDIYFRAHKDASSFAESFTGIDVNQGTLQTTGTGNIYLYGSGGAGTSDNTGVMVQGGGKVQATGTGTVYISGFGSGGTSNSRGVILHGTGTTVSTASGNLTIVGDGGGTSAGSGNDGVYIVAKANAKAMGGGNLTITGRSFNGATDTRGVVIHGFQTEVSAANGDLSIRGIASGSGIGNYGVWLASVSVTRTTGPAGDVMVTGTAPAGVHGIQISDAANSNASIQTNGGSITLIADGIDIHSTASITAGSSGIVEIKQETTGRRIDLGGADVLSGSPLTLGLSDAELDRITASTLRIGNAGSGATTISSPVSLVFAAVPLLHLTSGGTVAQSGSGSIDVGQLAVTAGGTVNLGFNPNGPSSFGCYTTAGDVMYLGTGFNAYGVDGVVGISAPRNISLTANSSTADLTVYASHPVTSTSGGNITLSANRSVILNANVSTTGSGTLTVTGNNGLGARNIVVNSGATVSTQNGLLLLDADQNASASGNYSGVSVNGGSVQAIGSGAVTVHGRGGSGTGGNNYGVWVNGGSVTSGGGSITVLGTGGAGTGRLNAGVFVYNFGSITSGGGDVGITGYGGGSGVSYDNYGVIVNYYAGVTAGGEGALSIHGTGGSGSQGYNHGVYVSSSSIVTTGGAGWVDVTGTGGEGTSYGVAVEYYAEITSGGGSVSVTGIGTATGEAVRVALDSYLTSPANNPLTVIADSLFIETGERQGTVSAGTGLVFIKPLTAGTRIDLGGVDVLSGYPLTLGLTDAELDCITAGTLQIGDTNSGTITVSAAITHSNHLSLVTGAGVTFNQAVTMAAGKNLTANATGTISLPNATSDLVASGTGSVTLTTAKNITLAGGSKVTTASGAITLSANQQATPTAGNFTGIDISGGTVNSGAGSLTLNGRGGVSANSSNYGVQIAGGGQVASGGGNVSVTGTGGGTGSSGNNDGIHVEDSQITAGGEGSVTAVGTGGNTTGSGSSNYGVYVYGTGATITSSGGNVSVTGTGGGAGSSNTNLGIFLLNGGQITAGGEGSVTVVGNGGNTTATSSDNYGVHVYGTGSMITSSGGSVSVTGAGGGAGTSVNNYGVSVYSGQITAGGGGSVTVFGTGGNTTGTGESNYGVYIRNTGATITSSGGNVSVTGNGGGAGTGFTNSGIYVAGGQITAGSGGSVSVMGNGGNASNTYGVHVSGAEATITSNGGNVSVTGTGGGADSTEFNFGVYVVNGGQVTAGGEGSVTIVGNGGTGSGSANFGVLVQDTGAAITSSGGSVSVTGTGGGTGASNSNYGIYVISGGKITAEGGGSVTVVGNGGNPTGSGSNNYGVYVQNTGGTITSCGGNVSVTGKAGSGNASYALAIHFSGSIVSVGSAVITLIADSIDIGAASVVNGLTNTVTLRPQTAGTLINLGAADVLTGSPLALGLTDAELDRITAGTLQIGDANSGTITVSATITQGNHLSLMTGAGITFDEAVTMAPDKSLTANAAGTINLATTNSDLAASGAGTITLSTTRNIQLTSGSSVTTVNGGITLSANQQATSTSGNFIGININGGTVNSGAGPLTLNGRGGVSASSSNYGVQVTSTGGNVSVTSTGGNVSVTGTGGGMGASFDNHGVYVRGSEITAGSTGSVTVVGNGGNTTGTSGSNYGIYVNGTGSTITSSGGSVSVSGTGGGAGTGAGASIGIFVASGGQITAGGEGSVTVFGYGGNTTGNGGHNYGVGVAGNGSTITSAGGDVSVTGTGGGTGSSSNNRGVYVSSGGQITAGGAGSVTVVGNGGNIAGIGGSNNGVYFSGTGSTITSSGGNVSVTGKSGSGSTSYAIAIGSGGGIAGVGGAGITLIADSMDVASGSVVNGLTNTVTLRPLTGGTLINLGGADVLAGSPLTLGLTDAELDRITAGTLLIGDTNSGNITISAAISPASVSRLSLVAGAEIIDATSSGTDITIGDLALDGKLGIGVSGDFGIEVDVDTLTATSLSGSIALAEANSATIGPAGLNGANSLYLNAGQFISGGNDRIAAGIVWLDSAATLNLNGFSDAINQLNLYSGPTSGALVQTGAGVLTLTSIYHSLNGSGVVGASIFGNLNFGGAIRAITVADGSAAVDLSISAVISNGGLNLGRNGSGNPVLVLSGNNAYTGPTTVSSGTLLVNGSTAAGSAVTISSGAALGGFGTVGGAVTISTGGSITGGALGTVGTLTVGSLTFDGGVLAADFDGNASDTITATGSVNLNGGTAGALTINSQSGTATADAVFMLLEKGAGVITNPPLTGAAEGEVATINGLSASFTYLGGDGNDFVFGNLDFTLPTSQVNALAQRQSSLLFPISITGSDPSPGSGVASYDLYVSTDGGGFTFLVNVLASAPTYQFQAASNHSYAFFSIAHDNAGNIESKSPRIEASTYVPDLTPPDTQVSSVNSATATFTVAWTGSDTGGTRLAFVDLYVSVDDGTPQLINHVSAGSPGSGGVHSGTVLYQAISDGVSHSYRFYTRGLDGNNNLEAAPAAGDVTINATFAPAPLAVAALDVQRGAVGRSYVRYVDLIFNQSTGLDTLISAGRIKLTKFDLNGNNGQDMSLTGVLTASGNKVNFDFGAGGIGGNRSTNAGDGYYRISLDLDGNGMFETIRHFYRLLGDVNGDRTVNQSDISLIVAALTKTGDGLNEDVDGDGVVTGTDKNLAMRARGRTLAADLPLG